MENNKIKILIADDDKDIRSILSLILTEAGYQVISARNGQQALDLADDSVDLYILDVNMPVMSGFAAGKQLSSLYSAPIIFLTAYSGEGDKVMGFSAGADDYMVKPIDLDELLLKIGALLRRAKIASSKKLTVGALTLDAEERSAVLDGEEIQLTVREFNLLYKLLSYPKKTFTRSQLMNEFWDAETESGPRTVDVYMRRF